MPAPQLGRLTHAEILAWIKSHTFLDPLWDASFKWLITDRRHPERLVHFLNSLLGLADEESITSAQLDQNEIPSVLGLEKGLRFDIHCSNQRGEPIMVEMQRNGTDLFKDRMLYYAARLIHQEIRSGDESYELPRIYVLCILNFCMEPQSAHYHRTVQLIEREGKTLFHDKLSFTYIELPQFRLREEELVTDEDRWLFALRHMGELNDIPAALRHPVFKDLFSSAKICNIEDKELDSMATTIRDQAAYNDEMRYARRKGLEEGIEKGVEQGGHEKLLAVVRNAKAMGLSIDTIVQLTGLDADTINRL